MKVRKKNNVIILVLVTTVLSIVLLGILFYSFVQIKNKKSYEQAVNLYKEMSREIELFDFYIDTEQEVDLKHLEFVNDYDFLYTYGDDMNAVMIDSSAKDFLFWLPRTFERFLKDGGRIIISNEKFFDVLKAFTNTDFEDSVQGIYFKDSMNDNVPTICINYKIYTSDDISSVFAWGNNEIHELAHYMDDLYEFSESDKFKEYFLKYAKEYEPKCGVVEGYQLKSEREFFAILITDILKAVDIADLNIPDELYIYMKDVFMLAEGLNI